MNKIRYYKFDIGNGAMKRSGPVIEYLDQKGNWIENRELIRKFISGDTDFTEITAEEAEKLVNARKKKLT